MPKLFIFLGPVAAGKSTQMNFYANYLDSRGLRVKKRGFKSAGILTNTILSLIGRVYGVTLNKENAISDIFHVNPLLTRKVWPVIFLLSMLDVFRSLISKITIPLKLGYTILAEDSLPAIVLDYKYFCEVLQIIPRNAYLVAESLLKNFLCSNDIYFVYLNVEDDVALRRDRKRLGSHKVLSYMTLHELLSYMTYQRKALDLCMKISKNRVITVQTSYKSAREVKEEILERLNRFSLNSSNLKMWEA